MHKTVYQALLLAVLFKVTAPCVAYCQQKTTGQGTDSSTNTSPEQAPEQNSARPPSSISASNLSSEQAKFEQNQELQKSLNSFIEKESQMLVLPDDDVVLGELTSEAFLEYSDMESYINIVRKNHSYWSRNSERKNIQKFIDTYADFKKKHN